MTEFMFGNNLNDCQYFSTTNHSQSKPTKVDPTTIPNPNRLLAVLIIVDECEGGGYSELRSNKQDYSGFKINNEFSV